MYKAMWSYFGSKTSLVGYYPKPKNGLIIEPFAGAAKYSLKYFDNDVLIIDKYPVIIKIWKWLQQCSPNDILKLPRSLKDTERLDAIEFDCEEAKLLMGFVVGCGAERPRIKPTFRKTMDRPNHINYNLKRIARDLFKIKHWQIIEGDYTDAPDVNATWFIDPPYQFGGDTYVISNKLLDFKKLAEWIKNRQGQVIACENTKATWMEFKPLVSQRGSVKRTTEGIWTNEPTAFDNVQLKLIA